MRIVLGAVPGAPAAAACIAVATSSGIFEVSLLEAERASKVAAAAGAAVPMAAGRCSFIVPGAAAGPVATTVLFSATGLAKATGSWGFIFTEVGRGPGLAMAGVIISRAVVELSTAEGGLGAAAGTCATAMIFGAGAIWIAGLAATTGLFARVGAGVAATTTG